MENSIYLDHAATTPINEKVASTLTKALKENYANASSIHQFGKRNRVLIEEARDEMAKSIGADKEEIVITSGGTESDNMALIKTAEKYSDIGKHIISTTIEHPAVLESLKYLETKGYKVTYLKPDDIGQITLEQVKDAIKSDTILISIMYGNNEIGSIQPIKEIGEFIHSLEQKIIFHTDAVQTYGVLDMNVDELKVDLLSVSSHKMNGPKGVGFLYIREGITIPSLILGGAQESEKRAGTENTPSILAFEKAIQINQKNQKDNYKYLKELKEYFISSLEETDLNYSINGTVEDSLPHILSISFPDIASDMLLIQLDLNGVAVSAGSACSAGSLEASHVLESVFGKESPEVEHTIRFSFGPTNNFEEIDQVIKLLEKFAK